MAMSLFKKKKKQNKSCKSEYSLGLLLIIMIFQWCAKLGASLEQTEQRHLVHECLLDSVRKSYFSSYMKLEKSDLTRSAH